MTYTIYINDLEINDVYRMESKYDGVDVVNKNKIKSGTTIAYKHKDSLTQKEHDFFFGSKSSRAFVTVWSDDLLKNNYKEEKFEPSEYQAAIREIFFNTNKDMVVEALAGSGKTSTLIWLLKEASKNGILRGQKWLYLAFNTNIRDELNIKLQGTQVPAMTAHQLGYSIIRCQINKEIQLSNTKERNSYMRYLSLKHKIEFTKNGIKEIKKLTSYKLFSSVIKLESLVKNHAIVPIINSYSMGFGSDQKKEMEYMIERFNISWDGDFKKDQIIDLACGHLIYDLSHITNEICFDDMIYYPIVFNKKFPKYDTILVDEAQDFCPANKVFLERLKKA